MQEKLIGESFSPTWGLKHKIKQFEFRSFRFTYFILLNDSYRVTENVYLWNSVYKYKKTWFLFTGEFQNISPFMLSEICVVHLKFSQFSSNIFCYFDNLQHIIDK